MGKLTFVIGGTRSGKSSYAIKAAAGYPRVAFIATCAPKDKEMIARVAHHKKSRPAHWQTFECPENIVELLEKMGRQFDCIIIDCLTLLASNWLLKRFSEKKIEKKSTALIETLGRLHADTIIVANEVGLGIVPANALARIFRDIAGRMNQLIAQKANKVVFMVAGIPMEVK
jgi:adenosylcobinamide kinase/adenosylcobinamide-phosphate guanylyltransferase